MLLIESDVQMLSKEVTTMAKVQVSTNSANLADILSAILDKGIVVDVWAKLLLLGTEILRLEARVVVASVETYLKYAEAIGLTRLVAAPATEAIAAPSVDIRVPASREIARRAVR
jgi:gas vesicle structural protein